MQHLTFVARYAFVAWDLDLQSLKQLALNSIEYSALSESDRQTLKASWYRQWLAWAQSIVAQHAA